MKTLLTQGDRPEEEAIAAGCSRSFSALVSDWKEMLEGLPNG